MVTPGTDVYLWGFPPGAPSGLPDWLARRLATPADLPVQGTVLVFEPAAPAFITAMRALSGAAARDQQAILYATGAGAALPEAWLYFADVVTAGDWPALRALIACPQQSTAAQLALEVPAAHIAVALELLAAAPYAAGALDTLPLDTPPGPELAGHLATCETCRRALAVGLEARREWATAVYCPPAPVLAAYAYGAGGTAPAVAAHLAGCPACTAEVAVLQGLDQAVAAPFLVPTAVEPAAQPRVAARPSWLQLDLGALAAGLGAPLAENLATAAGVIRAFVAGLRQPPLSLQPLTAGTHLGRTGAAGTGEDPFAQTGSWLLISATHEMTVDWDPANRQISLTDLRDEEGEAIARFRVVLQAEEHELWAGVSDAGRVVIPTTVLAAAMTTPGARLIIAVLDSPTANGGVA